MKALINILRSPSLEQVDIDGDERISIHRKMFEQKKMLRVVFKEFHYIFNRINQRYLSGEGLEIEIGAGIAPMKDSYPQVLATDIVGNANTDKVLDAEAMDLENESVRVFYGQNCFHHFPHPDRFFEELDRTLVPGGGAIILEPYYGPFAAFLYKRLFKTEGFDKSFPSWETPSSGPMNGANQALSYLVFVRDRKEFERKHPSLSIVHEEVMSNYLKYLLSGGLNFRQLCPDILIPLVSFMEWVISPLNRFLSLHHIVVIQKKLDNS
ncbi:methyltransferase domain-containing protein [uncultured Gimesia sp.]|uniref:class I SAM-dependent methyltransferase n=1 Tax=uncultured Gimesia sp. TaxID=1678688 RepID=UPI0030DB443A